MTYAGTASVVVSLFQTQRFRSCISFHHDV